MSMLEEARSAMTKSVAVALPAEKQSLLKAFAGSYGMEAGAMLDTLKRTIFPAKDSHGNAISATTEQVAAFVIVAHNYKLNPFTREIYAFPTKGGGIQPIVSVDGWAKIINDHPQSDGFDLQENYNADGKLESITCRMWRKDKTHPIIVTEYLSECARQTDPWVKYPVRMLRHKVVIQAARYAFGFSGIVEPDEAERTPEYANVNVSTQALPPVELPVPQTMETTDLAPIQRRRGRPPKKVEPVQEQPVEETQPETQPEELSPSEPAPREPGDEPVEPSKDKWNEAFK